MTALQWNSAYVHMPTCPRAERCAHTHRLWTHLALCGDAALHLAALQGNTTEVSRLITEGHVDIDAEESYGHHTALHLAVKGMPRTHALPFNPQVRIKGPDSTLEFSTPIPKVPRTATCCVLPPTTGHSTSLPHTGRITSKRTIPSSGKDTYLRYKCII